MPVTLDLMAGHMSSVVGDILISYKLQVKGLEFPNPQSTDMSCHVPQKKIGPEKEPT
ncbi:hypothetical protein LEMLEM_LOCUS12835 [Lemmus lemmus]